MATASPLRFWDDRLNQLLQVDGRTEAVCRALRGARRPGCRSTANRAMHLSEYQDSVGAVESGSAIERFHPSTKRVPLAAAASTASGDTASTARVATTGVDLPNPEPMKKRLHDAIRERRSAEGFDPRPIALGHLSSVLQAAGGNAAQRRVADVEIFAVAHRVAGIGPGAYRYAAESHRLVPLRTGVLADEMVAACLKQGMAGSAAAGS